MTTEERIKSHIEIVGECWNWTGAISKGGYGRMAYNGRNWLAHRLSYSIHVGPIPDGMDVCHRCDNPPCVNPDHLKVADQSWNMRDMVKKKRGWNPRGAMTICKNGHTLDGENLKIKSDGARRCLTCLRSFERERSKRRRENARRTKTSN